MIEIEDLHVRFNAGLPTETHPLRGLNLAIPSGQFVTVIGSNGAGKSTLLNVISGDVMPAQGAIRIDGVDMTNLPRPLRARHIARVFQDPLVGTCERLTVEENMALAMDRGARRSIRIALTAERRRLIREELATLQLGLEHKLTAPMSALSGGQRQVVSLLMATLAPSKLLLLDEHTAALDPRTAAFVIEMSRRVANLGRLTVMMVTHSLQQALEVGDRTVMLHGGGVILDIEGVQRDNTKVSDLLANFERFRGYKISDDALVLG
jgi:putative tryptophan/tyrosine transport system ATP-binding protein